MDPISEKVYSYLTKRVKPLDIMDTGSYLEILHQGPVYECKFITILTLPATPSLNQAQGLITASPSH